MADPSSLPRSTPEAQGISAAAILAFVNDAEKEINALHSFMVVRHGHVVAEGWWAPYNAASPHELASLSKSFTSTAVGMAIAEGKLSLTAPVLSFFPESAPAEPSANLKAMRVRDLLIMSCGQQDEVPVWNSKDSWIKAFLAAPVPFLPGTHFRYNSPGTYMLSAIVQKATGMTVLDYLKPRLFAPLGIETPTWDLSPEGINTGGWGLSLRTEDLAKFGQLYLQKGQWQGRQLLPATWVELATSRQTSSGSDPASDWEQGYGYQFWRCKPGFYRGDGAHGQFCVVMPGQDAVVAVTGGTNEMQAVMDLMWKHFVPALQSAGPLPPNEAAQTELTRKLASLTLQPQNGAATSPQMATFAGRTYVFPQNDQKLESLTVRAAPDGATELGFQFDGKTQLVSCRPGAWSKARFGLGGRRELAWGTSGAWTADDTYSVRLCAYETAYFLTASLKFTGDEVVYESRYNVDAKSSHLVGHAGSAP